MNYVYIAVESLAAITILILIYANIYEAKQHSAKRDLFTKLLIANEIVVVADVVSWLHLGWEKYSWLLGVLIAITYIVPAAMQIYFILYLYEHISIKTEVSKKMFTFMVRLSMVEGIIIILFISSGKLFSIQNGKYLSGPLVDVYFILNILSMLVLEIIVLMQAKKISRHDLIAALSFGAVPFLSLVLTLIIGLNFSIPLMAVCMLLMYVMLQSENETFLYGRANLDELTGLLNRSAYEDEVARYETEQESSGFVYASIDVNGLKVVNDTLGHAAGDELICGAAKCLKSVLGKAGKVFRIGGDEFVSIVQADAEQLKALQRELEAVVSQWKGNRVEGMALSVGYVAKWEFPDLSIVEIAKLADKRMYEEKSHYYASKGIDRRGQNDAHKVLCALYTKILKINITDDSYTIINMDPSEQIVEKGYVAYSISEWLESFGKSGQVHPEDLETYLAKTNLEFMSQYFKSEKTSLSIGYRRKYENVFKQVMMEIIPTSEYRDDNQVLYLYVKDIDI